MMEDWNDGKMRRTFRTTSKHGWEVGRLSLPRRHAFVGALAIVGLLLASEAIAAKPTFGDDPSYLIDSWETEDGLPENSATSMVQTPDGHLWFGTWRGLVRFDGLSFRVFNTGNTPQLPSDSIVNLHLDHGGGMWISTDRGLVVNNGKSWRRFGTNDGWAGDFVRTFAERTNGDLLMTTFDGHVLEFVNGRFKELPAPPGLPGKGYFAHADQAGQWWVAQNQFVGRWDGQHWLEMVRFDEPVVEGAGGGTGADGSLLLVQRKELRRYRLGVEVQRVSLADFPGGIWSVSEDSCGNVWIATFDLGLCRVQPDGTFQRWTTARGLSHKSTRFVFEDRERNLWVGTDGGGLMRFKPRRFQAFGAFEHENGLTERIVRSVWPDGSGGLWVASHGLGLFHLTSTGIKHIPVQHTSSNLYGRSVLQDRAGRTWFGMLGQGVCFFDAQGEHKIPAAQTGGVTPSALFEDSQGRVWIAGDQSLAVFESGAFRIVEGGGTFQTGGVICMGEDEKSDLWFSNLAAVFRRDKDRCVEVRAPDGRALRDILCFKAEPDGTMWMGTRSDGLWRWRDGRISRIGAPTGFPVQAVHAILDDGLGYFWMPSNRGIVRAARKDLHAVADGAQAQLACQLLDQHDGLPSAECSTSQPSCARDSSGRLWFATQRGVATIDPAAFRLNSRPPPVQIEQVEYQAPGRGFKAGTRRPAGASGVRPIRLLAPFLEPLRLPSGSYDLEIKYTALSFSSPEKARFQTRLEGGDGDWEEAEGQRLAHFYQLPPGDYVFRVRAANNDGVWNEAGASLAFTVLPFFWQTWWFRVGAFATLFSSGGLAAWWGIRRRHQKEVLQLKRAQQQQAEVAHVGRVAVLGELASSLAHELNQPLGAILRNAEAAELFLQTSSPDLEEVRAILTDIRRDDQRAGEVIDRMRSLLKRRPIEFSLVDLTLLAVDVISLVRPDADTRKVRLTFEHVSRIPPVRGDSVQLQQVLLNLLVNAMDAVKDSVADRRRVTVRVRAAGKQVEVAVSDTGHGIPADKVAHIFEPFFTTKPNGMGMGLPISSRIIEAHGGQLWAENNPDGGATFHFSLPIAEGRSNQ